jgi:hypothetical protein
MSCRTQWAAQSKCSRNWIVLSRRAVIVPLSTPLKDRGCTARSYRFAQLRRRSTDQQ